MPSSSLLSNTEASPHVRVRSWHHRAPRHAWPAAAHAGVEVAVILDGGASYRVGSREVEVGPGQAIAVSAGAEHATAIEPGTRATSVWVDAAWFADVAASLGRRIPSGALFIESARRVASLLALLDEEARAPELGRATAVDGLAEALVISVLRADERAPRTAAPSDPRVLAAIAMIEDRLAEPLGLDELADAAGVSRFHFCRLFRAHTGKSPYRFLTDRRMDRARELLQSGRYGVTEAALSVGFPHLPRFARAFRERHGAAPSALTARSA
jgi:AraC-like DNA-binding protein